MQSNLTSSPLLVLVALSLLGSACSSGRYGARPAGVAEGPGGRAIAVVRVRAPWYAPRFVIRGKFLEVLPEYEALGPLEAKYFTISDDGEFGGLYVWATRADAEHHFDPAWHAKVRQQRGADGDVLIMDAPYVIGGPAFPRGEPVSARSEKFPAWVSVVRWDLADAARITPMAQRLARATWSGPALIRGFVVTGATWVGVAALWATRAAAEGAAAEEARASIADELGATGSSALLFEAPLLIDATLAH